MRKISRARFARLVLLAGVFASRLPGQGDRGVITGTVTDASGANVPGAAITVIQKDTNTSFKTTTSTAGDFTVPSLPVGSYRVRTERPGFKTDITDNVVVVAGGTVRVDVILQVGQTQQRGRACYRAASKFHVGGVSRREN